MIKQINGNLIELALQGKFSYIAHGCNCHKMMGAGIAGQIKQTLPEAYYVDSQDNRSPLSRLGDYTNARHLTKENHSIVVYNLYTQFNGGANLNYAALDLCLYKLSLIIPKEANLGLPRIGCGIAGGDWRRVHTTIRKHFFDHNLTIVNFKPQKPF